jgi:signal transduction histidine kinase
VQRARHFGRSGTTVRDPVVLQLVVREVLDIAAGEIRGAGIEVDTQLPDEPVTVSGDPVQLAQVLLNLLLNALQASPPPVAGGIELRLWTRAGLAVLTVRDHGQGIPPEHLPQIGSEFFTTKPQGTGLGLSIARQLVGQHGGQLVLCNAPGGGAEATLSLPCRLASG